MHTIAIIGSGNVGGALAKKWKAAGHTVLIGARYPLSEKNITLATQIGEDHFTTISSAVKTANVILMSTPAITAVEVAKSLGDTQGKVIIDTMNIVMAKGPHGYSNTADAILDNTVTRDVVKCFNTTGFGNIVNPMYSGVALDAFVAGDSEKGRTIASELARDAGFAECYNVGGNDKFEMMEQFAWFWINLAMVQGHGREIGFKLMKR